MNQDFNNERDPLPTFGNEPDFSSDEVNNRAPLPEYADSGNPESYDDPEITSKVEYNFKKALASAIMSMFPITSVVALFFSHKAWKTAWSIDELAKSRGVRVPGKNIAAKILSGIGKGYSIFCTIFYALYFGLLFIAILSEM